MALNMLGIHDPDNWAAPTRLIVEFTDGEGNLPEEAKDERKETYRA